MLATGKEYAAHRGVHPSRVSQWKRQGRLVFGHDGRIDVEATDKSLNSTLDQVKGLRRGGNITSTAGGRGELTFTEGGKPVTDDPATEKEPGAREASGYWGHKTQQAAAEAKLKQMQALEKSGGLVRADAIEKVTSDRGRALRNAMLAIADRVAPVLDPANPGRAHKLLTSEIDKALREFSDDLEQRALAAGAVEECDLAVL